MSNHFHNMIEMLLQRPLTALFTASTVGWSGTIFSRFETATVILQLILLVLSIITTLMGAAIGAYKLKQIWKKEFSKGD